MWETIDSAVKRKITLFALVMRNPFALNKSSESAQKTFTRKKYESRYEALSIKFLANCFKKSKISPTQPFLFCAALKGLRTFLFFFLNTFGSSVIRYWIFQHMQSKADNLDEKDPHVWVPQGRSFVRTREQQLALN